MLARSCRWQLCGAGEEWCQLHPLMARNPASSDLRFAHTHRRLQASKTLATSVGESDPVLQRREPEPRRFAGLPVMPVLGARPPLALCFAGSGCLAAYQLGVIRCLQRHGTPLLSRVTHVIGCSGGALAAAVLAHAPAHTELAIEHSLRCQNMSGVEAALAAAASRVDESRKTHTTLSVRPVLVVAAATAAAPRRLRLFAHWESTDELLSCLRASCHIPSDFHPLDAVSPFASSYTSAVSFRGQELIDGGLAAASPTLCAGSLLELDLAGSNWGSSSGQHARLSPDNVIVSPFAARFSGMHIAPSGPTSWKQVSISGTKFYANAANARRAIVAMGGGAPEEMQKFVQEGEADCERFLRETGQYETVDEGAAAGVVAPPPPPKLLRKPLSD